MRTLIHLSDTHILPTLKDRLQGVDTLHNLRQVLQLLVDDEVRPDALVVSGDLANHGERESYRRLRQELDLFANRLQTRVVVAIGNHDERRAFREVMLAADPTDDPIDYVAWIGGLRLIVLDSTVPGEPWGEIRPAQRTWLQAELARPAAEGSILVLHHPPVPDSSPLAGLLTLHGAAELEEVVRGSDIVAVLAGHAHHAITAAYGGVFCYAAPATAYTVDPLLLAECTLRGVEGAGFGVVRVIDGRAAALTIALPSAGRETYRHALTDEVLARLSGAASLAA